MNGIPKWVNTRQDMINIKNDFGDQIYLDKLQELYNARLIWVSTGEVTSIEDGITDETHKVMPSKNDNDEDIFIQLELQVDSNAYIFSRLDYTDEEVRLELGLS